MDQLVQKNPEIFVTELSGESLETVGEVALTKTVKAPKIALSHDSRYVYVVNRSPRASETALCEIDLRSPFQIARSLPLPDGDYPGVAVHCASRRVFISDPANRTIWVVNRNHFSIQWQIRIEGGEPGCLAMSPTGDVLYVLSRDCRSLWAIDPNGNRVVGRMSHLDKGLGERQYLADGSYLFVWRRHMDGRVTVARVLPKASEARTRRVFTVDRRGNCRSVTRGFPACLAA